jgi:hypothetical protein
LTVKEKGFVYILSKEFEEAKSFRKILVLSKEISFFRKNLKKQNSFEKFQILSKEMSPLEVCSFEKYFILDLTFNKKGFVYILSKEFEEAKFFRKIPNSFERNINSCSFE